MYGNYPPHMWLAGDGEGVVLVCEGPCRDNGVGDLVIAEYGETERKRGVPRFDLTDLAGFLGFVERHGRTCKTEWEPEEPNWGPLEALIPRDQWGEWMWMSRVEHNGVQIEQYKHQETRGYISLSKGGQAWKVTHTWNDCDPWCDKKHEHITDGSLDTVTVVEQSLEDAFRWANVWPWSLNDKDHPAPEWVSR